MRKFCLVISCECLGREVVCVPFTVRGQEPVRDAAQREFHQLVGLKERHGSHIQELKVEIHVFIDELKIN